MARTESKVLTCHPRDEQEIIDAMQKFHWSLLSTQEVKTVDNFLQKGTWGDDNLYQVRKKEHYVKLSFSRDVDMPNLNEIKKLEAEYLGLPAPDYPKRFPISLFFFILGSGLCALVVGLVVGYVVLLAILAIPLGFSGPAALVVELARLVLPCIFTFFVGHWVWRRYYRLSYMPKMEAVKRVSESNAQERRRILSEMEKYQ